jgi:hypothetical protein
LARRRPWALPAALAVASGLSLATSIWLIASERSAAAFFMSPPRAFEFLIGSLVAIDGLPVLNNRPLQLTLRGVAVVLILFAVFGYQQGPDFPGVRALLPCGGAALFIWCGTGIPNRVRHPLSFLAILRSCGQISYSLYLWHWPIYTLARFAKAGLVLDLLDKTILFALTVAISYLSWRYVEQPFRTRALVPARGRLFGMAAAATLVLVAGSVIGNVVLSRALSDADREAARLDAYNSYDYQTIYRAGSCFGLGTGVVNGSCLALAPGKTNLLLWGDSFAAQYYHGLREGTDPEKLDVLQATMPACMPTLDAEAQANGACRGLAAQMQRFFAGQRPDLVVMTADWLEYARPPRFAGMIADIRKTLAELGGAGIPVVLLGPAVQFRSRLPSILVRMRLRGIEGLSDNIVLPEIFGLDAMMKGALPSGDGFAYVSVLDAVCPKQTCPLMVRGVPLSWDHAHLTSEGSAYVMTRLIPMLPVLKSQQVKAASSRPE